MVFVAIRSVGVWRSDKLELMHTAATESPKQDTPDFRGLLAALTAPDRKREPAWNDRDLAEDVATLSYESALRMHSRYQPSDRIDGALRLGGQSDRVRTDASEKDRKCASITIRVSKAECEQLHRRAAEAGLTLSAYVRSCTLEAEALRAQVKQALAEMRKTGTEGPSHPNEQRPLAGGPGRDQGNNKEMERLGSEGAGELAAPESRRSTREAKTGNALGGILPIGGLLRRFSRRRVVLTSTPVRG